MRVAIQMDQLSSIDVRADSSWMMLLEALSRGFTVWHYHPDDLSWHNDTGVSARARPLKMRPLENGQMPVLQDLEIGAPEKLLLASMDVILMRQDPPFDMHYLSATYMLERLPNSVVLVNNPAEVRNAPEKILVMDFAAFMPPTLISNDQQELREFWQKYGHVIVKPLYGNGGAGIFHLRPDDDNFDTLFEMHRAHIRTPLQIQQFLPAVNLGDKRILLLDGEPVGAIDRIPSEGQTRANMHVGGKAVPARLTLREREICAAIKPTLVEKGMIFVGIDVIDGMMTEINVTSPTGIQEVNRFDEVRIEAQLWDSLVQHRRARS